MDNFNLVFKTMGGNTSKCDITIPELPTTFEELLTLYELNSTYKSNSGNKVTFCISGKPFTKGSIIEYPPQTNNKYHIICLIQPDPQQTHNNWSDEKTIATVEGYVGNGTDKTFRPQQKNGAIYSGVSLEFSSDAKITDQNGNHIPISVQVVKGPSQIGSYKNVTG